LLENKIAEPKHKNTSFKHEYQKRRKEGEEKAHEDGSMVGDHATRRMETPR